MNDRGRKVSNLIEPQTFFKKVWGCGGLSLKVPHKKIKKQKTFLAKKIDNQAFLRYNNRMSEMNRRPENEFEQLKGFEEDARGFAEGD